MEATLHDQHQPLMVERHGSEGYVHQICPDHEKRQANSAANSKVNRCPMPSTLPYIGPGQLHCYDDRAARRQKAQCDTGRSKVIIESG